MADDEAMFRAGIRAVLSSSPDLEVVAEAADGRQAVQEARAHRPDVVLLDIRMPALDGLSAAAELRRAVPETAAVVLTTFSEDEYVTSALEAGVSGFLLKSGDPYELMSAVRAAHDGAAFLAPKVAHQLITRLSGGLMARQRNTQARVDALTPRERDVLALVGEGMSNAEIGRRLFLVEGTVKVHVSAVLARLGVRNRVQARGLGARGGHRCG